MRLVLVGLILLYQRTAPKALRERCIFSASCSHVVLRRTREGGVRAGLSELVARWKRCRPGYFRLPPSQLYPEIVSPVCLSDGSIVELCLLSSRVQTELQ